MFVIREEDRVADIKRKISIIKTLLQKCEQHTPNIPVELTDPMTATMFLTNQPKEIIQKALVKPKIRDLKTLLASYQDLEHKTNKSKVLRCHIHEFLYDNYVTKRYLLRLKDVYDELKKCNVLHDQLEILKKRGFIWRKLQGDKCILIEDPEVQAKRIKYLLDMKRFREANRIFVYVEEKAIPADAATLIALHNVKCSYLPDTGTYQYIKIAVSPQLGVLAVTTINDFETFTNWLIKEVTPHLKESFVLVLDEKMITEVPINQAPNPEATKEAMINWLERNDIPCSSNMHRAELYELIDTFKDKLSAEKTLTDANFKGIGVEILKRPDGWPTLNYFDQIWTVDIYNPTANVDIATTVEKRIQIFLDMTTLEKFQRCHEDLEAIEANLYEQDMELEEVIDKLFTMAKDGDMPEVDDLPNYWEVEGDYTEKYVKMFSSSLNTLLNI